MKYNRPALLTLLGLVLFSLSSCFQDPTDKLKEQVEIEAKTKVLEQEILEMKKQEVGSQLPDNWRDKLISIKEQRMAIDSVIAEREHEVKALTEELEKNNLRLEEFRATHTVQ